MMQAVVTSLLLTGAAAHPYGLSLPANLCHGDVTDLQWVKMLTKNVPGEVTLDPGHIGCYGGYDAQGGVIETAGHGAAALGSDYALVLTSGSFNLASSLDTSGGPDRKLLDHPKVFSPSRMIFDFNASMDMEFSFDFTFCTNDYTPFDDGFAVFIDEFNTARVPSGKYVRVSTIQKFIDPDMTASLPYDECTGKLTTKPFPMKEHHMYQIHIVAFDWKDAVVDSAVYIRPMAAPVCCNGVEPEV